MPQIIPIRDLRDTTKVSEMCNATNEPIFVTKNGYGDMVYETVNANSLSAFVKEQISENGEHIPDWLNGLVNVYEQTTVSVRRAAHK